MSLYRFRSYDGAIGLIDAGNNMGIEKEGDWFRVFWHGDLDCICLVTNVAQREVDSGLFKPDIIRACDRYSEYLRDLYNITNNENTKTLITERLADTKHYRECVEHDLS